MDKEFIFNDCHVCINPNKIESTVHPYKNVLTAWTIKTAKAPNGKWIFGFDYECRKGGGRGNGASYGSYSKEFETEKEAIKGAVEEILSQPHEVIDQDGLKLLVTPVYVEGNLF